MTALIFDCDGVLADTERDGHRPAFNATFAELSLPVSWSESQYAELVRISGGKERMATLLTPEFVADHGLPTDPVAQRDLLADWHRRKTAHYRARAASIPGRPGVLRLARAAAEAGWSLAVASTSAPDAVSAVLEHVVGPDLAALFQVFAGDVVSTKKPAPDIYLLALAELGAAPEESVVVEDSANGLRAARAAGITTTVITMSSYTAGEDFTGAVLVVDSLGDPDGPPARVRHTEHSSVPAGSYITLADLDELLTVQVPSP